MKQSTTLFFVNILFLYLLSVVSCISDRPPIILLYPDFAIIHTTWPDPGPFFSGTILKLKGEIQKIEEGVALDDHGFIYSITDAEEFSFFHSGGMSLNNADEKFSLGPRNNIGNFSTIVNLSSFNRDTVFKDVTYRAYATYGNQTVYGGHVLQSFLDPILIGAPDFSEVYSTRAFINCSFRLQSYNHESVQTYGVCWKKRDAASPTIEDDHTIHQGSFISEDTYYHTFQDTLIGLEPNKIYVARTYVQIVDDTIFYSYVPYNSYLGLDLGLDFSSLSFKTKGEGWQPSVKFPYTEVSGGVAFTLGNKGYFGLGLVIGLGEQTSFWQFDSITEQWSPINDFPGQGRSDAITFSINGKGYLGLGQSDGNYLNDFWEYNPSTNIWRQVASFPGNLRSNAVVFSTDQFGYVGMGKLQNGTTIKDFWYYDPLTDIWANIDDFPGGAVDNMTGAGSGSIAIVGLGDVSGITSTAFWKYDELNSQWVAIPDYPESSIEWSLAFNIEEHFFVMVAGLFNTNYNYEYNQLGDNWQQVTSIDKISSKPLTLTFANRAIFINGQSMWEYIITN